MVCLQVIVVGGGISGLSTAFSLQRNGHNVTVLESASGPSLSTEGVKSPPNMTRILNTWGLAQFVQREGVYSPQWNAHDGEGHLLGRAQLYEQVVSELDAGFYFFRYSDLYAAIQDLVQKAGVKICYRSTVKDIDAKSGMVYLETGGQMNCDLIIAASGTGSSFTTERLNGSHEVGEKLEGQKLAAVTVAISVNDMDEEGQKWCQMNPGYSYWLGDGYVATSFFTHRNEDLSLHFTKVVGSSEIDEWNLHEPTPELLRKMGPMCSRLSNWIQCPMTGKIVIHTLGPSVEHLVDECVVWVGNAAHPLGPNSSCAVALAIEDAEVLGQLLGRIHHKSELSRFLAAFEELRLERCQIVQQDYRVKIGYMHLKFGIEQKQRDNSLKDVYSHADYHHMDESRYSKMWGNEIITYQYHAKEEVDDWWTKWSTFFLREGRMPKDAPLKSVSIYTSISDNALSGAERLN